MKGSRTLGLLLGLAACATGALAPLSTQAATRTNASVATAPVVTWEGDAHATIDPRHGSISTDFFVDQNARVKARIYRVGAKTPVYTQLFMHDHAFQVKTIYWNGKLNGKPVQVGKYFIALKATSTADMVARSTFGPFTALHIAPPKPAATSPAATTVPTSAPVTVAAAGKHIVVSLSKQTLYAYTGSHLDLQTLVTTGNPALPTPTGTFSIMTKQSPFWFISPWPVGSPYYYAPSLSHYAMLFRSGGYYIHDAPWRSAYGPGTNGAGQPGTNYGGTHGCVNVPENAMIALWNWTPMGTTVYVVP